MAHQTGKRNTAPLVVTPAPLDEVADIRVAHQFYGEGQYPGPVSLNPGQKASSPLADNLRASASANTVGDGDVLDGVQAKGVRGGDFGLAPLTRDPSSLGKPRGYAVGTHPAMSRQQDPSFLSRRDQLPTGLDTGAVEQVARKPK